MKLVLRNQIAEWLLEALAEPAAEEPLMALIAFARRSDDTGVATGLTASETTALEAEERLFESTEHGLELREDLLGDLDRLRWRAQRFEKALAACRRTCGRAPAPWRSAPAPAPSAPLDPAEVTWSLCAAAALFNAELFFEVHEILEPPWIRAEGPLKSFLQGLIQVAVGLHHQGNGNLRGSIALLADGNAKLRPFLPEAWGVELGSFCSEIDRIREALQRDAAGRSAADLSFPRLVVEPAG